MKTVTEAVMESFVVSSEDILMQYACSKDETRINLLGVYFDREHGVAVATNGMAVAMRSLSDNSKTPWGKTIRFQRRKSVGDNEEIEFFRVVEDVYYAPAIGLRAEVLPQSKFPVDFHQVFQRECEEVHICFSPSRLIEIAKSLDVSDGEGVMLSFSPEEPLGAIRVATDRGTVAVLMPCKQHREKNATSTHQEFLTLHRFPTPAGESESVEEAINNA